MELAYAIGFIVILLVLRHFGLLPRGKAKRRMPETRPELDTDLLYGGGLDASDDGEEESGRQGGGKAGR